MNSSPYLIAYILSSKLNDKKSAPRIGEARRLKKVIQEVETL